MGADKKKLRVETRSPSGHVSQINVSEISGGVFLAKFTPNELGLWQISVLYNNEHCHGSPFMVSVYDPNGIRVYNIPDSCSMQRPVTFHIDTARAGAADVSVDVLSPQGQKLPCNMQRESPTSYACTFTPQTPGHHTIRVIFAGHDAPGSPFGTNCVDPRLIQVSGDGLGMVPVNRESTFYVELGGADPQDLQISLKCIYLIFF